jgi:hypothetical protein
VPARAPLARHCGRGPALPRRGRRAARAAAAAVAADAAWTARSGCGPRSASRTFASAVPSQCPPPGGPAAASRVPTRACGSIPSRSSSRPGTPPSSAPSSTPPRALHRLPGRRPLFPGRSPARPVAPQTLTRRLRQHGIEPRQARNAALAAWASDLPPAVLASLLGVHIQTAVNWASHTRRDWTTYIAERVGTPHQGTWLTGYPPPEPAPAGIQCAGLGFLGRLASLVRSLGSVLNS